MGNVKSTLIVIVFFFVALFIYTKLFGPITFSVNNVNTDKTSPFQTTGTGTETAIPDTALISLGVTNTAPTVEAAKDSVNTSSNKITADLIKLGVDSKNITTTDYSVVQNTPQVIEPTNVVGGSAILPPTVSGASGYTVTQSIQVKVSPIEKANQAVDTATADGANLVGGVSFVLNDNLQKQLEQKARVDAVNDAKQQAQDLANAAGIKLGRIINVVDNNSGGPTPLFAGVAKSAGDSSTNLNPGQTTVQESVTLTFETQ